MGATELIKQVAALHPREREVTPEISFLKALLSSACYFALLLASLTFAVNTYADLADPPVVDPNADHWFLLSGFGGWLWFGAAFALPALVLVAFAFFLGRIRKTFRKDSQVADYLS
jgi:hypothetical protein